MMLSLLVLALGSVNATNAGPEPVQLLNATGWPHTYQNCQGSNCNAADQIKSDVPCVEFRDFKAGTPFKKFGSNLKVTLYLRNRCESYHTYNQVLECTSGDEWVEWESTYPVQSYKVESCV